MVWTAPITFTSGQALTSGQLNTYLRDNLNETAPAKAVTPGGYFVVTGPNQIAERNAQTNIIFTTETATSTSFLDLDTEGPSVTMVTGGRALVITTAWFWNSVAGAQSIMSHQVTGATSISASDSWALIGEPAGTAQNLQGSYFFLREDLSPGENTFTAKYRVTSGTGSFRGRRLTVIPF